MKKILILFTSILILSCNNSNQNKKSVDSIPMTKINESKMKGEWVSLIQQNTMDGWHYFQENGKKTTKINDFIKPEHIDLNLTENPDIAQTIAVTCFGLGISCDLYGLHTLKIKETDRLKALKIELTKLGGQVKITNNSFHLSRSYSINTNISIDTYTDHRMAMAFAPLALLTPITINNPDVVSKSYKDFWKDLESIGFNFTKI
jgi:3-phosphoshikimate 1-carboxyvinyltransferase